MRLQVGQASFRGAIARYAQRFDLVEVTAESGRLPRRSALEAWRSSVPDEFVFSVALPSAVASLETTPATEQMLDFAEQVASTLRATWWILKTPASVTPSAACKRRLSKLVERLSASGRRVAWEPRGIWMDVELESLAQDSGLYVVRDGTREALPQTPVVYTRIRALGSSTGVGLGAVEILSEQLEGREEAVVVVEGEGAARVREILQRALDIQDEFEEEQG